MTSAFVFQGFRRRNAKGSSRRDDACECTPQERRQREDRRHAENIEMHTREVVVGESEPQGCANANTHRHLSEGALENDGQDVQRLLEIGERPRKGDAVVFVGVPETIEQPVELIDGVAERSPSRAVEVTDE